MMERNALSMAEGLSLQVETFVQQAILTSTSVKPIGKINIAHGCVTCPAFSPSLLCYVLTYLDCSSILSDVIFDNVFSDIAFHSLYPLFPSHSRELTVLFRQDQGVRAQRQGRASERESRLSSSSHVSLTDTCGAADERAQRRARARQRDRRRPDNCDGGADTRARRACRVPAQCVRQLDWGGERLGSACVQAVRQRRVGKQQLYTSPSPVAEAAGPTFGQQQLRAAPATAPRSG
jgi:hypothetical protein